jgi:penicillin-binding protein 2
LRPPEINGNSKDSLEQRLHVAALIVLILFGVLFLRLWFLQVVNGWTYKARSENNRIHQQDIPPIRGVVYDRSGEMLVNNRPSYDLYIVPEEMEDREQLFASLNQLIGLDRESIISKLKGEGPTQPFRPICVKRNLTRDELAIIETHRFNLPGVTIQAGSKRHYLFGGLCSHVLGYVGEISEAQLKSGLYPDRRPGDLIGKAGVERKWESSLNGKRGGAQLEVDAAGRVIKVVSREPPMSGANVSLTIDKSLQALGEKAMEGKRGAIVAMNPKNGEILAMVSNPGYDPNLFVDGIDRETWEDLTGSKEHPLQNRALSSQYPPGSVFKIVVALAALEEGVVDENEKIFCGGALSLGNARFQCWKKYGHGYVDLERALVESCDVYFYTLGKRLGIDKIAQYARRLGLGNATGFDPLVEKGGLIPTREWKLKRWGVPWQAGETLSSAIGQSFVLVTPIQMAAMISAVFNGGTLYRPHVTQSVIEADGKRVYSSSPDVISYLHVRPEHLQAVQRALIGVVNSTHGTGKKAALKGITVAGKTGTAQVVALGREKMFGDQDDMPPEYRDHAWFVAVAPAEDPAIALAVFVEHGGHGGSAAAPIAKDLISAYLEETQFASNHVITDGSTVRGQRGVPK